MTYTSINGLITPVNQGTSGDLRNSNLEIDEDQNMNFIRILLNLIKPQTIWDLSLQSEPWDPSVET